MEDNVQQWIRYFIGIVLFSVLYIYVVQSTQSSNDSLFQLLPLFIGILMISILTAALYARYRNNNE